MMAQTGKIILNKNTLQSRILIVDDDPICQKVHNHYVHTLLGFSVDIASNGAEALSKYSNHKHKLILLDSDLGEISGFEVSKKIREEEKVNHKKQTIIFMITSHLYYEVQREYALAGIDEFITKPLCFEKLNTLMEYWLSN